jgi:hypothetical protein
VLAQISAGERNRALDAEEIIDAFTDLERQLVSQDGDTRSSRTEQAGTAAATILMFGGAASRRGWFAILGGMCGVLG